MSGTVNTKVAVKHHKELNWITLYPELAHRCPVLNRMTNGIASCGLRKDCC